MPLNARIVQLRGRLRHPVSLWRRVLEACIERLLFLSSAVSVIAIALIFVFLFREGLGALWMASPRDFVISVLQETTYDPATDSLTTTERPGFVWAPVQVDRKEAKVSVVPLLWGSFQIAVLASLFSTFVGIAVGLYLSEMASPRLRERLKPALELLVGIPTVVVGFFMLAIVASPIKAVVDAAFGSDGQGAPFYPSRFNAFIGALGVSVVIIPVIASLVDDALQAVGRDLRAASLSLGATRWQTSWRVVLPAAFSGVMGAVILGFGRALGETMIVVMCAGNSPQIVANPFASTSTMTARIASELGAASVGGLHYKTLFLIGALLVTLTFVLNILAEVFVNRYRRKIRS